MSSWFGKQRLVLPPSADPLHPYTHPLPTHTFFQAWVYHGHMERSHVCWEHPGNYHPLLLGQLSLVTVGLVILCTCLDHQCDGCHHLSVPGERWEGEGDEIGREIREGRRGRGKK